MGVALRDYINLKVKNRPLKNSEYYLIKSPNGKPLLFKVGKVIKNVTIFEIYLLEYGLPYSNLKDKGWYLIHYRLTSTNKLRHISNLTIRGSMAKDLMSSLNIRCSTLRESDANLLLDITHQIKYINIDN